MQGFKLLLQKLSPEQANTLLVLKLVQTRCSSGPLFSTPSHICVEVKIKRSRTCTQNGHKFIGFKTCASLVFPILTRARWRPPLPPPSPPRPLCRQSRNKRYWWSERGWWPAQKDIHWQDISNIGCEINCSAILWVGVWMGSGWGEV